MTRAFLVINGGPKGIRTPVTDVRGQCPRPLDDGTLLMNSNVKSQLVIINEQITIILRIDLMPNLSYKFDSNSLSKLTHSLLKIKH